MVADALTWKHGTPPALLQCELAAVGYRQISHTVLKGGVGYLAIFEPPSPEERIPPGAIKPCLVSAKGSEAVRSTEPACYDRGRFRNRETWPIPLSDA